MTKTSERPAAETGEAVSYGQRWREIKEVCERYGFTRDHLAQLRFTGTGPRYYAPTPRTIRYKFDDVDEWIESSARYGTAPEAVAR
ncbi:helix-turn-helix transcriptional regulator [Pseudoclavibacter sp. 13-3]|uniref:helix-turn-helix transcriptional regulator n=1 Tax=Pseudoclavibacter sp. 13-3 TaxID=2901228 RepID=UPI001E5859E1|nr:hypothetical protein [Pseudoclavibacter sp. 13-3]MCD7101953.1 hypothetical protein [Pseudoclavibacter sp. 13-3]